MFENEAIHDSSVVYALNTLSKEVLKLKKTFTIQDLMFKKCMENLDFNLESSQKIQDKVKEYIELCKVNEMHIQKIIHQSDNFKESFSEILKTENSSQVFGNASPSLYDEIKEFEVGAQKHDNVILISEANLGRLNSLKGLLKNLREEVKKITNFSEKESFSKETLIRRGLLGNITVLNI